MGDVVNKIILLLTCVFEVYVVYRFMYVFFERRKTGMKITVAVYAVRLIAGYIIMIDKQSPVVNMVTSILGIFLITFCYESSLSKKIVTVIIIYMCMFLTEAVTAFLTGISDVNMFSRRKEFHAVLSILIELLLWSITLVFGKLRNVRANIPLPKSFTAAMILVFAISFCMESLIFQQNSTDDAIAAISLVCVVIMNFLMIYLYDSLSGMLEERTKTEIIKREKTYYHKQSELLQRNYEELKRFRHDIKNRMLVLKQMADKNELEKMSEYISAVTEKIDSTEVFSQTGNIAMDSIINYELNKAQNDGIEIKSNIIVPAEINIKDDDIVVILGNLFDNAIEAVNRLKKEKWLSINLEYEKNCVFIAVKNSYDNIVNMVNGQIHTRKKNQTLHGIGLRSVQAVLDKYNGLLDIEYNDKEFMVHVILYIS
ncbi:MAG: GHKL domain-containing protein [Lachnospiraceae bacterium]|nr:GHKL domain-containing protein [Lachnospiraceae bacterium]